MSPPRAVECPHLDPPDPRRHTESRQHNAAKNHLRHTHNGADGRLYGTMRGRVTKERRPPGLPSGKLTVSKVSPAGVGEDGRDARRGSGWQDGRSHT